MNSITVPTRDQVSPEAQELFDLLKKRVGKVPNLYATIGHSSHNANLLDKYQILEAGNHLSYLR